MTRFFLFTILTLFTAQNFSQDKVNWKGKEYFVYPTEVEEIHRSLDPWIEISGYSKTEFNDFTARKKRLYLFRSVPQVMPYFGELRDGPYIAYGKGKGEKIVASFNVQNGMFNGDATFYNSKGKKIVEGKYKDNLKEGTWTSYTNRGLVSEITNYNEGLLEGENKLFFWNSETVRILTTYHQNKLVCGKSFMYKLGLKYEILSGGATALEINEYDEGKVISHFLKDTSGLIKGYETLENGVLYFTNDIVLEMEENRAFYRLYSLTSVDPISYSLSEYYDVYNWGDDFNYTGDFKIQLIRNDTLLISADFQNYMSMSSYGLSGMIRLDSILVGNKYYSLKEKVLEDGTIELRDESEYNIDGVYTHYLEVFHDGISVCDLYEQKRNGKLVERELEQTLEYAQQKEGRSIDSLLLSENIIEGKRTTCQIYTQSDSDYHYLEYDYFKTGELKEVSNGYSYYGESHQILFSKDGRLKVERDPDSYDSYHIYVDGKPVSGTYDIWTKGVSLYSKERKYIRIENNRIYLPMSLIANYLGIYGKKIEGLEFLNGEKHGSWEDHTKSYSNTKTYDQGVLIKEETILPFKEKDNNYLDWRKLASYDKVDLPDYYREIKKQDLALPSNFPIANENQWLYYDYSLEVEGLDSIFKTYKYYPDGSVYDQEEIRIAHNPENNYLYEKKLTMTPNKDTISWVYSEVENGETKKLLFKHFNKDGLYAERKSINQSDTCSEVWYEDGVLKSIDTLVGYKNMGTSQYFENGIIQKEVFFERVTPLSYFNRAFFSEVGIEVPFMTRFIKTRQYESGVKRIEYYIDNNEEPMYNGYSYNINAYDTLTTFYDNGNMEIQTYIDTLEYSSKSSWIVGYYPNGKRKFDGWITDYKFEMSCDEGISLPKFDIEYVNYFDENGVQTLTNGTGSFFRMDAKRPISSGGYLNGKRDGIWKTFDNNGNLNIYGKYANGVREGIWYEGDLQHINFIEQCLDTSNPSYEEIKSKMEKNISIEIMYYKEGKLIKSDYLHSGDEYGYYPSYGRVRANF